jgi:hypothetical protein
MTASIGTPAYAISSVTMTEAAQAVPLAPSVSTQYRDHGLVLDLISDTSLVDIDVLNDVLNTATLREASLIDVLYEGGFIAYADMRAIVTAYDAVTQGFLYQPWAKQALHNALAQFIPFDDMLLSMGLHPTNAFSDSFITELIITSQLLTGPQMERARLLSLSRGLTIGQSLVQLGLINIATYKLLLDGTARYRNGHLSQSQLREMVNNTFAGINASGMWHKLSQTVHGYGVYIKNVEVLEALDLLVEAELLTEIDVLGTIETALERSMPFEQVAGECLLINPAVFNLALKLQKRVSLGETAANSACQILRERYHLLQGA